MTQTSRGRHHFITTVYPDRADPAAIRLEFTPRGLQAVREPGGPPGPVPTFSARARLVEGKPVVEWEAPPPESWQPHREALERETADRLTRRLQWLDRLSALVATVEAWAQSLGWATRRVPKDLKDSEVGAYQANALLLQEGVTRVLLEPIGRSAPGAEGVVDLYRLPAYDDIATLYYYDGRWNLHFMDRGEPTAARIRDAASKPLTKANLRRALDELKQHVA